MLTKLKFALRDFIGLHETERFLAQVFRQTVHDLIDVLRAGQIDRVLACITVLADVGDDARTRSTAFGAEQFMSPGESATIIIPMPQRPLARLTYFISGHPNLVITSFEVDNECAQANFAGVKFGQTNTSVGVGCLVRARVEYRIPGKSL